MKYIIAISGSSNNGKTSTIKRLYGLLTGREEGGSDIDVHFQYNGRTIYLISKGDPNTDLLSRLTRAVGLADIVVCACRTKGDTKAAIEGFRSESLRVILVGPIVVDKWFDYANDLLAETIKRTIDSKLCEVP